MATVNGIDQAALNRKLATPGAELSKVEFRQAVTSFKSEMEMALPMHLKKNADKYARQAMSLFSQNPELQKCTGVTILSALMTATGLGLELTPALGQCYIIPYENRKKVNGSWVGIKEAQFQLGYRGAIALAMRSGEIRRIAADVVYEKDYFKYSKGLNAVLEHEESLEEDRGSMTYVYALAEFKNGGYTFDVWPMSKVIAHAKKFSKSYYKRDYKTGAQVENDKSPWVTHFESMAKKTLIMAIWKYLPISTEALLAAENDESIKRNVDYGNLHDEKDIITITPTYSEEATAADIIDTPRTGVIEGSESTQNDEGDMTIPFEEKDAPQADNDVLEILKTQVDRNMGGDGLDFTAAEKAEFFFSVTKRRDLDGMTEADLRKILAESAKRIKAKDAKG